MYGGQVVLVEADETQQGDLRRFNATIDESKAIAGRATVELGRLVVSDANGTIKHWPMINSRRLEHSRRQAERRSPGRGTRTAARLRPWSKCCKQQQT